MRENLIRTIAIKEIEVWFQENEFSCSEIGLASENLQKKIFYVSYWLSD
jgi:hypothetical protein